VKAELAEKRQKHFLYQLILAALIEIRGKPVAALHLCCRERPVRVIEFSSNAVRGSHAKQMRDLGRLVDRLHLGGQLEKFRQFAVTEPALHVAPLPLPWRILVIALRFEAKLDALLGPNSFQRVGDRCSDGLVGNR